MPDQTAMEELERLQSEQIRHLTTQMEDLRERVRALEIGLHGPSGGNGIRGEVREVKASLQRLHDKFHRLHIQIAAYAGGAVALVWLIDRIAL